MKKPAGVRFFQWRVLELLFALAMGKRGSLPWTSHHGLQPRPIMPRCHGRASFRMSFRVSCSRDRHTDTAAQQRGRALVAPAEANWATTPTPGLPLGYDRYKHRVPAQQSGTLLDNALTRTHHAHHENTRTKLSGALGGSVGREELAQLEFVRKVPSVADETGERRGEKLIFGIRVDVLRRAEHNVPARADVA